MALALKNDKIPPSINYTGPNPYIDFDAVHFKVADTVTDWPRYSGHAITGVSGFGFGGANAHLVLREVLPSDLVEPGTGTRSRDARSPSSPSADAVYVGGVRMDEYGEFIHDDDDARRVCDAVHTPRTTNHELPGLTDEAKRLLEVAPRGARSRGRQPELLLCRCAVSGFLTSRKKATAAELADWIDSPEGRASSLESIGRSLSRRNHGRSRAVVLAHDHDEAVKGLRALAEGKQNPNVFTADGPVTNGPVWVLAGFGAQHRKMAKSLYLRNETFAEWINKVDALVQDELGYSVVELILDDSQDYGIETTQTVIFAIQIALGELLKASRRQTRCGGGSVARRGRCGVLRRRPVAGRRHPHDLLPRPPDGRGRGHAVRRVHPVDGAGRVLRRRDQDGVLRLQGPRGVRVCGADPDGHRRPAGAGRRDHRAAPSRRASSPASSRPRAPATPQQMDPLLGELAAELQGIEPHPLTTGYFSTVHEGQLHPARRRADPRRGLLEEGTAPQRPLHPGHPQRRRQRAHHFP